jgi:hypothetical protein
MFEFIFEEMDKIEKRELYFFQILKNQRILKKLNEIIHIFVNIF